MRKLLLRVAVAATVLLASGVHAEERILSFLSDVRVQEDSSLDVTETIRVVSEGEEIRRGIQRDFPTRYTDRSGRSVTVAFEVTEVRRDGRPEPWELLRVSNGARVRIGDPNVMLTPGEHIYVIAYRTTRQLGFFPAHDELYWNVTGNGWTLPITTAEARVRLPRPAAFGDRAVYTGPQGSTAAFARVVSERPGDIRFRTTAPLAAEEGLTIAIAWPKNVVVQPSPSSRMGWWLGDNGPPIMALFGLFGVLAYYVIAWRRAGRGPPAGTVVPIFTPPEGMTAAAVRYVSEMDADNRAFAAALIDLGVHGRLRLREGEKGWFSGPATKIEKVEGGEVMPPPETAMVEHLFAGSEAVLMDDKNHATFTAAQNALQKGLKEAYEGRLFVRNWMWSVRGVILILLTMWLVAATLLVIDALAGSGWKGAALPVAGLALIIVLALLLAPPRDNGRGMAAKIGAAFIGLITLGVTMVTIGTAFETGRPLPILVPLLALPIAVSAFWWMAAPTRQGRDVLDRIAGFRQYLSITEEHRLQSLHPPEKTPQLFERYLPYAVALEVENDWASRFTSVLAAAAESGQGQAMHWYSGHEDPWSDPDGFADRIGSSLASSISSASSAPGSSSGSSGGGSSGGGGGGGGGSGW